MLFWRLRSDQDIVDVTDTETQISQHLVQETLEDLRCVPEAERHYSELLQIERCRNTSFRKASSIIDIWWNAL